MRTLIRVFILVCLSLLLPVSAPAQQKAKTTPADVYLRGYLIMEDGMKLLQGSDFSGAYYKLKDAKDIFDGVFHSDPNWNPEIVEYRRKRVTELMESARQSEMERRKSAAENPSTIKPVAPKEPAALPMLGKTAPPRSADVVVQSQISELRDRIKQLELKNDNALKEIGQKEESLSNLGAQLVDSEIERKRLLERMVDANDKLERSNPSQRKELESLKKDRAKLMETLEKANAQLAEVTARNSELLSQVREAYETIKSLNAEKTQLVAEREQMNELLGGSNKADKVRLLATENSKLRKSLEELQSRVTAMQKEREAEKKDIATSKAEMAKQRESDQILIAELRGQLDVSRAELARIRQENEDYENQMAALSARLDVAERTLAQSSNPAMTESDAVRENNMLHEIIVKMIKQQSGRERAKKQAIEELEATGQMSEELVSSIRQMSEPYQMSPAERALLQAAGMPKLNADGSGINGQMISPDINPEAERTGASVEPVSPDEVRGFATAAQRLFSGQQFEEAESAFEKVLTLDPLNVGARCNLAVSQVRQGKLDTAIINLKKALAYDFDHEFPHYLLGTVFLRQNKLEDATEEISTALKIKGNNGAGHSALGLIYTKQKRFTDAMNEFKLAVQFDPEIGEAHFNLAILYAMAEPAKKDLAKHHYREAMNRGVAPDKDLELMLRGQ